MAQFKIRKRVVYELVQNRNNSKTHLFTSPISTAIRKTPAGIARSLAWRRIFAKYGNLSEVKVLCSMECDCEHNIYSRNFEGDGTENCRLHVKCDSRGYFAKLAKRYAAIIERAIIENDVSDEDFSVVLEVV